MKLRTALLTLILLVAACGDDDAGSETTTPATTAAATSQAPTTVAATTTAAPTTTEAPATTVDPFAEAAALIAEYEGAYEGMWVNTTFGSDGPIAGNIAFDLATLTITVDLDLGGFVFGAFDPEPETFTISIADVAMSPDGTATVTSATFGEMQATVTATGIELYGADVPDPGIATMLLTGDIGEDGFTFDYVIEFEGGGGAEGTATMTKTG